MTSKRTAKTAWMIVLVIAGIVTLVSSTGCDSMDGFGTGFDSYGYFTPDYDTVQSVLDYQDSVYESANDAWTDYIRM